jgi:hypothetical protein
MCIGAAELAGNGSRRVLVINCRAASFDHLVGAREQRERNFEAESSCGLEINAERKLSWLFDWQIAWFRTLQNLIDMRRRPPEQVGDARPVGYEAAGPHKVIVLIHRRQAVLGCQLYKSPFVRVKECR